MKETARRSDKLEIKQKQPSRAARGLSVKDQSDLFEKAIHRFHQRKFKDALEFFEQAAAGPVMEVSHSARTHARICRQKIESLVPALATAEDHYNYGVALLNERNLELAEKHLRIAAELAPGEDHVYYALAVCYGLQGSARQAYDSLKRAIELHPRNRSQARSDPDFAALLRHAEIRQLLFPEPDDSA